MELINFILKEVVLLVGLYGLLSIFLCYILSMVCKSFKTVSKGKYCGAIFGLMICAIIVGGTKPPSIPKVLIEWDAGLHDAGSEINTNDLRYITFRWTYENWVPDISKIDIKAYDIHTVNPDPTVDRGFYVCTGVPITDRSVNVMMETDATNYCYYVSQSYIPDAPVVTNGVYHIHAVGTNNVWIPIGLKIFEDSRIISPHKGDNNEQ